jgi:hypothetical protein
MVSTRFSQPALFRHQQREFAPLYGHVLRPRPALSIPGTSSTPLPVLELDRPQPVPQPLVQRAPDFGVCASPEVGFPSQQVGAQSFDDFRHAAPARASGQLPDPLLERRQRLVGHLALDRLPCANQKL